MDTFTPEDDEIVAAMADLLKYVKPGMEMDFSRSMIMYTATIIKQFVEFCESEENSKDRVIN